MTYCWRIGDAKENTRINIMYKLNMIIYTENVIKFFFNPHSKTPVSKAHSLL